ncbi:helix-turn-helix transcriptional regulator [Actinomyces radicidentis]|uniref:helix-turn-helix transcriptional regulator n=1 Tax=Actinomyces radicidentis TaxID=111015 RepID=UPI0014700EF7|nr:helix-turn-helix transcriptional regulator [Actinomyces radicidentis]
MSSSGYVLGAGMVIILPWIQTLHHTRDDPDLRQGRTQEAAERAAHVYLPPDATALIDAELAVLAGQPDHCIRMAAALISSGTANPRWVMVAQALRAGLMTMSADTKRDGLHELTARQDALAAQPGLLALLPDPPRSHVLAELPAEISAHQGLRVGNADAPAAQPLTPRQREVLECLSRGLTMAQVAEELVLGVETVRSTAKAVYKRLGVHDREAAIQIARMSGQLP